MSKNPVPEIESFPIEGYLEEILITNGVSKDGAKIAVDDITAEFVNHKRLKVRGCDFESIGVVPPGDRG